MRLFLRFELWCLGKPPTSGAKHVKFIVVFLLIVREAANCRQQALIIVVVDAAFLLFHIVVLYMWLKTILI